MASGPRPLSEFVVFGLRHITMWLSLIVYFILAPFGYALFALLVALPTKSREKRGARLRAVMHRAFNFLHTWMRWLRILHFRPRRLEAELPDQPCVVIANHPTLTDTTAILGSIKDICTAVKPSIYRLWWLKPLLAGSRQFEGAFSNPLGGGRVIENAVERLQEGLSILIFPEATRTIPGQKMAFRRTAFEIACRADVPVVPIVVRCQPAWLSKDQPLLRPPFHVPKMTLDVLQPLRPEDFDRDSRRMLTRVESLYYRALGGEIESPPTHDRRRKCHEG